MHRHPSSRRFSASLLLAAAGLAGCASTPEGPIWTPLEDAALHGYVQQLVCRLATPCGGYPVLLVDMREPQAEALPDGRIAVRLGLLLAVEEEAELVFVLAHELAHRRLGHRPPRALKARLPLELQADAAALVALRRLGYADDAPARLITRIRPPPQRATGERERLAQQQLDARLAALPTPTARAAHPGLQLQALLEPYRNR
jgi:hypothetical protein